MALLIPGRIGLVAIHANGTRELVRVIEDPIGDEGDDSDRGFLELHDRTLP
jgi:hypothetical protein